MQNTTNKPRVFVVGGPTASGKTALSIDLANELSCPIINADSRQVFKELNIGVAKPNMVELSQATHHMVSCWDLSKQYSVADYTKQALLILNDCLKKYQNVVVTGGTGFYIKSLFNPLDSTPSSNSHLRKSLEALHREQGIQVLVKILNEIDPQAHLKVDIDNYRRVIRAIEMIETSGKSLDSLWSMDDKKNDLPFEVYYFGIDHNREYLYNRINERVDIMINEGLEDEVRSLLKHKTHPALQSVGYTEFFDYFDGIRGLNETIELIKQKSRNYAKRQTTWFKNQLPTMWLPNFEIIKKIKQINNERSTN